MINIAKRIPVRLGSLLFLMTALTLLGCQAMMKSFSGKLTNWQMLGDEALEDPIKAVGGSAFVFVPPGNEKSMTREELAKAPPEKLVSYYSPIFVQQRADPNNTKYAYAPEIDRIGEAHLKREADGKLKSYVAGNPVVYAIYEEHIIPDHKPASKTEPLSGRKHAQLTYTAWYPGHPRMKFIDVEAADIDSCVVRITLDEDHAPLFYETIAACGCFHKIFVQRSIEEAARKHFGPPESDHKYSVEHDVPNAINWDVGGVIDEPRDRPMRPVVFLKAGDHKVIGVGSTAKLRMPPPEQQIRYQSTSYDDLKNVQVDNSTERDGFFDMENGGKVRGGERKKEKFLFALIGVDDAGRPRDVNAIKMHFDQSTWSDVTIYGQYLRLPPGTL